jgi:hypothetical protein
MSAPRTVHVTIADDGWTHIHATNRKKRKDGSYKNKRNGIYCSIPPDDYDTKQVTIYNENNAIDRITCEQSKEINDATGRMFGIYLDKDAALGNVIGHMLKHCGDE